MKKKGFQPPEVLKEYKGDCLKDLPLTMNVMEVVEVREETAPAIATIRSARYKTYLLSPFYKHISRIF